MCEYCQPQDHIAFRSPLHLPGEHACYTSPTSTPPRLHQPPFPHHEVMTTQDCHHYRSHEIIRPSDQTPHRPCCEVETHHLSPPPQPPSTPNTQLINLLKELQDQYFEDTRLSDCTCTNHQQQQRQQACPTYQQDVKQLNALLRDLIDHLRSRSQYSTHEHYHDPRSLRFPYGPVPPRSCQYQSRWVQDSLFEVLFRVTRRRRELTRLKSRSSPGRRTSQYSRLVERLLQEIEASFACRCDACREDLNSNIIRLQEINQEDERVPCTRSPAVGHGFGCFDCAPVMPRIGCGGAEGARPRDSPRVGWMLR